MQLESPDKIAEDLARQERCAKQVHEIYDRVHRLEACSLDTFLVGDCFIAEWTNVGKKVDETDPFTKDNMEFMGLEKWPRCDIRSIDIGLINARGEEGTSRGYNTYHPVRISTPGPNHEKSQFHQVEQDSAIYIVNRPLSFPVNPDTKLKKAHPLLYHTLIQTLVTENNRLDPFPLVFKYFKREPPFEKIPPSKNA